MKTLIISISVFLISVIFVACGNNNSKDNTTTKNNKDTTSQPTALPGNNVTNSTTVNEVVTEYLDLKNALVNDESTKAASASKELNDVLAKIDESAFTPEQKKLYGDLKDDIREHAEHISANGSNIVHQREHFDLLSKDIIDLVKATGSTQTLYKDFCPMYNNKKGASWLSETKDIKNPYYGKEMQTCGEVREEIKPKG